MSAPSPLKKLLNSRPFLFLVLVFLIWVIISVVKVSYNKYLLKKEIDRLNQEIERLDQENSQINQYIEYLQSDSFLEKEAKSKMNLKNEGEEVVVVPGITSQEGASFSAGPEELTGAQKKSFWWKWWEYFFE